MLMMPRTQLVGFAGGDWSRVRRDSRTQVSAKNHGTNPGTSGPRASWKVLHAPNYKHAMVLTRF